MSGCSVCMQGVAYIDIDGLVQNCNISIANALEILQSCTKPSMWLFERTPPQGQQILHSCYFFFVLFHFNDTVSMGSCKSRDHHNMSSRLLVETDFSIDLARFYICENAYLQNSVMHQSLGCCCGTLKLFFIIIKLINNINYAYRQ